MIVIVVGQVVNPSVEKNVQHHQAGLRKSKWAGVGTFGAPSACLPKCQNYGDGSQAPSLDPIVPLYLRCETSGANSWDKAQVDTRS
jgi:hypothetical protein